jgi:aminoglycoside phosphotransferase (APT) family kinase protein
MSAPPAEPAVSRNGESLDTEDLEPRVAQLLDAKLRRHSDGPYRPKTTDQIVAALEALLRAHGMTDFELSEVHRMAGGASKEQFSFRLRPAGGEPERMVLRMDPCESIVETCRYREAELFALLAGSVPVPTTRFLDGEGTHLGQPGIVTDFIDGVTSPPASGTVVSGVGTAFTDEWRHRLVPQFVDNLARIHAHDWRSAELPHSQAPVGHPRQAALWQVNWWARVWRDDLVDPYPLITLAERWMRERLPPAAPGDLVLLHGDYRTGNFMFDPDSGQFQAVLDWELAHIGDFHEDLGWIVQRLFAGPAEDGRVLVCSLLERDELISRYESATGRTVNRRTLAFYELLAAYKCAVMNLGSGYSAAIRGHNHQDVLLSFLAPVAHVFLTEIARIIAEESRS